MPKWQHARNGKASTDFLRYSLEKSAIFIERGDNGMKVVIKVQLRAAVRCGA